MLHEPQRDGEQVHCLALHPLVNKLHLKMLLARRHSRFDSYICPMVLSVVLLYRTSEELRRREKQLQTAWKKGAVELRPMLIVVIARARLPSPDKRMTRQPGNQLEEDVFCWVLVDLGALELGYFSPSLIFL